MVLELVNGIQRKISKWHSKKNRTLVKEISLSWDGGWGKCLEFCGGSKGTEAAS